MVARRFTLGHPLPPPRDAGGLAGREAWQSPGGYGMRRDDGRREDRDAIMTMHRRDAIDQIKQRIRIVDLINRYVPLRQVGSRFVAPCPFHDETKPSFTVNPEGTFYCFGCQKAGDIFSFWMEYNGVSFREALEALAAMAGVTLEETRSPEEARRQREKRSKRQQLAQMYQHAQRHFQANLSTKAGEACRAYMEGRGITADVLDAFGLGWAQESWNDLAESLRRERFDLNLAVEGGLLRSSPRSGRPYDAFRGRLMFPIRDSAGDTIAFGGRIIVKDDSAPKYVNTTETPIYTKGEHLYGLDRAGRSIRVKKSVYLTEGYMDVLTLHQFGYTNAVGGLGTALTDQQVQRLVGYSPTVMLLYDGDRAGRKAALAASAKFLARGITTRVILQPEGEDIDSLLRTQGPEAFDRLCEKAPMALTFCARTLRGWSQLEALKWCHEFLSSIRLPELVSPAVSYLARALNLGEAELRRGVRREIEEHTQQGQGARRRVGGDAGAAARVTRGLGVREREVLRCLIRYPEHIETLRDMGADLLLQGEFARQMWRHVEEAPTPEEAGYSLTGEARRLWDLYRGMEAPPRDNPELEFAALQRELDRYNDEVQKFSLSAVLRQNDDQGTFEAGREFLGLVSEKRAEHNDEQS